LTLNGLFKAERTTAIDEEDEEEEEEEEGEEDPNLVYVYTETSSFSGLIRVDSYIPKDVKEGESVHLGPLSNCLWTIGLIGSSLVVACYLNAVMVIWTIMGATVCFLVAFVLPTIYFLRLAPLRSSRWSKMRRLTAKFLLILSVCACLVCTTITVIRVMEGSHSCPKWT